MNRRRNNRTAVHLSIPDKLLDAIEDYLEKKPELNRTDAILYFIRIGMRIDDFRIKCEDPEFAKEVKASWTVEETAEWLNNMPEDQKKIISQAWELAKRKENLEAREMMYGI